jgi:hypothetical protein
MSRGLLPTGSALPSLPTLMAYASGSNCPSSQQRALSALNTISRLNALFKLRPTPSSLFLQQVLYFSGSLKTELVAGHTVPKSTVLLVNNIFLKLIGELTKGCAVSDGVKGHRRFNQKVCRFSK